jgi:hypothetical protein
MNFEDFTIILKSWDSEVGIATRCEMDDQEVGVLILVGARIFISPYHPHRFWGPLSLLSDGYRGLFPRR